MHYPLLLPTSPEKPYYQLFKGMGERGTHGNKEKGKENLKKKLTVDGKFLTDLADLKR